MQKTVVSTAIGRVWRGIARGVAAKPWTFAFVSAVMLALQVVVPLVVLSLVRKPVDYFAFNPWLASLPSFLASNDVTVQRKIEAVSRLALFWFSSSNPYGVEWGFSVDAGDVVRFLATSLLIGAYFSLWVYGRGQAVAATWRIRAARGGVLGGFVSVLGLATGPCSVMGCGAPIIPVVGLALMGLSSTALTLLHALSTGATMVVLLTLAASLVYLGWRVGGAAPVSHSR
jgi:hypothetical protein